MFLFLLSPQHSRLGWLWWMVGSNPLLSGRTVKHWSVPCLSVFNSLLEKSYRHHWLFWKFYWQPSNLLPRAQTSSYKHHNTVHSTGGKQSGRRFLRLIKTWSLVDIFLQLASINRQRHGRCLFAIFAWIIQIVGFTLLREPFWIFAGAEIMWRHVKMISYKSVGSVDILSKIPPYWEAEGKHGWKEIGKFSRFCWNVLYQSVIMFSGNKCLPHPQRQIYNGVTACVSKSKLMQKF